MCNRCAASASPGVQSERARWGRSKPASHKPLKNKSRLRGPRFPQSNLARSDRSESNQSGPGEAAANQPVIDLWRISPASSEAPGSLRQMSTGNNVMLLHNRLIDNRELLQRHRQSKTSVETRWEKCVLQRSKHTHTHTHTLSQGGIAEDDWNAFCLNFRSNLCIRCSL